MDIKYGDPIFVILWVFGWATIFLVARYQRARRKEQMLDRIHKERMLAMEKGIPLPELPDYERLLGGLSQAARSARINPRWPLGIAAIVTAAGIGLSAVLWLLDGIARDAWPVGLLGVFLGVGLCLHYRLTRP